MGLGADAELIWGIPVLAYDENTGEPTPFWDEENEDWREFPDTTLKIRQYGHYEDPDNHRGILTSTRVEPHMADCWEPTPITRWDIQDDLNNDKLYSKCSDELRSCHIEGYTTFYGEAKWWLVASFG